MSQQNKIILLLAGGLIVSLGVSALIYFWPSISKTGRLGNPPKQQEFSQSKIYGISDGKKVDIQEVDPKGLTVSLDDGKKETYVYADHVYVFYRNKPGVKGSIQELKSGQMVEIATSPDGKGNTVITQIVIEQ